MTGAQTRWGPVLAPARLSTSPVSRYSPAGPPCLPREHGAGKHGVVCPGLGVRVGRGVCQHPIRTPSTLTPTASSESRDTERKLTVRSTRTSSKTSSPTGCCKQWSAGKRKDRHWSRGVSKPTRTHIDLTAAGSFSNIRVSVGPQDGSTFNSLAQHFSGRADQPGPASQAPACARGGLEPGEGWSPAADGPIRVHGLGVTQLRGLAGRCLGGKMIR